LLAGNGAGVFVAAGLMAIGAQLFYCSVFVLIADVSTDEAKERPFAVVGMVRAAASGWALSAPRWYSRRTATAPFGG